MKIQEYRQWREKRQKELSDTEKEISGLYWSKVPKELIGFFNCSSVITILLRDGVAELTGSDAAIRDYANSPELIAKIESIVNLWEDVKIAITPTDRYDETYLRFEAV